MEKTMIRVWDLPVRIFHWLLVLSFAGAFVTAESERLRDVHVVLGYTVLALLAFRLVWAFCAACDGVTMILTVLVATRIRFGDSSAIAIT